MEDTTRRVTVKEKDFEGEVMAETIENHYRENHSSLTGETPFRRTSGLVAKERKRAGRSPLV
jgi:hypothetical protein